MKFQILIIAGTLILLFFLGCDKTESTKQIQNIQENTATDDSTQLQPIQDNDPPKEEQTTSSADNNMPAEPVLNETSKPQQEDQTADLSDNVKMVEYIEYTVKGVRDILRFPGAGGRHKRLPQKIELKVRCLTNNPELCECLDGAYKPAEYIEGTRYIVTCDQTISTVYNIHKHGTINSFEKLLKYVKQSPEKHQYAVSFLDINFDNKLPGDHRDAVEIRKLCPVQNGVISEDCECFSAKSHDPDSFLITSGALIKCPESTK